MIPSHLPNIAFLGMPEYLRRAYPERLRHEMRSIAHIIAEDIDGPDWENHADTLAEVDVLMGTWGLPRMDAAFLEAVPRLKAVLYAAGTVKPFVTDAMYERGIAVSSAAEANAIPVAELTQALILLSLKRYWHFSDTIARHRKWIREGECPGAYGSVVGLVSFGSVAKKTAALLSRLDVKLIAFDPYLSPTHAQEFGVELVSLSELFRISDVISIHSPLLPETAGLIDGRLLRSMKPDTTLINTSRGAIIDEKALADVLSERRDLTAILDVLAEEPPAPSNPLLHMDNVRISPHIAGSMGGEVERMGCWMLEELRRFRLGEPLLHEVKAGDLARMA